MYFKLIQRLSYHKEKLCVEKIIFIMIPKYLLTFKKKSINLKL